MGNPWIKAVQPEHAWVTQAHAPARHFEVKPTTGTSIGGAQRGALNFPRVDPLVLPHSTAPDITRPPPVVALKTSTDVALVGSTLALGAGAPLAAAEGGAALTRAMATVAKWGPHLFKMSPWGWAASAAWLAYDSGVLNKLASTAHALLGPPPELQGWKEELLALPDQGPTVLGGAPLPPVLRPGLPQGYEARPHSGPTAHIHPDGSDIASSQTHGGRAIHMPSPADHILLSQGASRETPLPTRPTIAKHPGAPKPRIEFQVGVYPHPNAGFTSFDYEHPFPPGANPEIEAAIDGSVRDGVMTFTYRSVGGDPASRPSGTDLFINAVNALEQGGIPVHVVDAKLMQSKKYRDNTTKFDAALRYLRVNRRNATQAQLKAAVAQTPIGKMLKRFDFLPMSVRIEPGSGNVIVRFENPEHVATYGPHGQVK